MCALSGILYGILSKLCVLCQVFYTVFYSPDNDVYTNEINTTESMANALIVSLLYLVVLCVVKLRAQFIYE